MKQSEALRLALRWAASGVPVFPVALYQENGGVGKTTLSSHPSAPEPRYTHGHLDASLDPEVIEDMFNKAKLGPGQEPAVGLYPGPAGWVVLDVDIKRGASGVEDLDRLEDLLGPLPTHAAITTASGGKHLILRKPEGVTLSNRKPAPGIDVRSDGGWIVAGGSTSPWGDWSLPTTKLSDVEEMPTAWVEHLLSDSPSSKAPVEGPVAEGGRDNFLTAEAGYMRRRGMSEEAILAALRVINEERCDPPVPERDLKRIAASVARYEPDPEHPLKLVDRAKVEVPASEEIEFIAGGEWVFSEPDEIEPIWGEGNEIAWAEGEALMLVGSDGTGKTALAHQLLIRLIGIETSDLLGYPVQQRKRVLYLAVDRPRQAARAFKRLIGQMDREVLNERLAVVNAPMEALEKRPTLLLDLATASGSDVVIVDSVKDVAGNLSDEVTGQAVKRAYQTAIAGGVEVLLLHHDRKAQQSDGKRKILRIEDVFGSRLMVGGLGSIISLNGRSGDPVIDLRHIKQPMGEIGPFQVQFDFETGGVSVYQGTNLLDLVRSAHVGITAADVAKQLYGTERPSSAEVERARRKLKALIEKDLVFEGPKRHPDPTLYHASLVRPKITLPTTTQLEMETS